MMTKLFATLAILVTFLTSAKAQVWNNLEGSSPSPNGMAATDRIVDSRDTFDVYAVGGDDFVRVRGQAYSCRFRTGHPICANFFGPWITLNGLRAQPGLSAVAWGAHREVFALGFDHQLWHNYDDDGQPWSGWQSLEAPVAMCSIPSAVSWSPGRIDVFVEGCDERLWHRYFEHGWQAWEITPASGYISGPPSATTRGPGNLDVAVLDASGYVYDASYNGSWSYQNTNMFDCGATPTVAPLVPPVVAAPTKCSQQQIVVSQFVPAYGTWIVSPFTGNSNPYDLFTRPAVSGNKAFFFYLDLNWQISYITWSSGSWSNFGTVGTDTFWNEPIPVKGIANGYVYVFASKTDGSVWYTYFTPQ